METPRIREIIDLSVPLESLKTPVFEGDPMPMRSTWSTVEQDGYSTFLWIVGDHAGTHVDAPSHFLRSAKTIDVLSLNKFSGHGIVLDFTQKKPRAPITKKDVEREVQKSGKTPGPGTILLFHTGYTEKMKTKAWMEHPEVSEEAARYLVKLGVSAIGVDASSPDHAPYPAHKILLGKNIVIYENLAHIERLQGKDFLFIGVPLPLVGGSASPVRALAILF